MTKYNVGDKVRVKVTSSYYGTPIDTTKQYTVFEVYDTGRIALKPHYLVVRVSDVEPWIDDITVWTDKNGVTREYREVNRKANVGELVKVTSTEAAFFKPGDVFTVEKTKWFFPAAGLLNGDNVTDGDYVVLEPTDIVIHDGKRYREVKRDAKPGDLILAIDTIYDGEWKIGDVFTVSGTAKNPWFLDREGDDRHYGAFRYFHVLEPITVESPPTPSVDVEDRITALETEVSTLKSRVAALETKITPITLTMSTNVNISGGAKYTREEVVEMAKKDVETLTKRAYADSYPRDIPLCAEAGPLTVKFHVNRRKRTVTALCFRKHVAQNDVRGKGIAHCAPDDCFNVWIGKAIALRRALGLDVPSYYTSAPKPTKVSVGDIVTWKSYGNDSYIVTGVHPNDRYSFRNAKTRDTFPEYWYANLLDIAYVSDDSHDFGGESA